MGKNERRAYLEAIYERYRKANRFAKQHMLNEFCQVCGYQRKYAIRLLGKPLSRSARQRPGRKPVYHSPALRIALTRIWLATDQMCSKKLKAALPCWLPFYASVYEPLPHTVYNQLLSISAATIDRLLKHTKAKRLAKRLGGTKPGSLLCNQIPLRTSNWDLSLPGYLEADTVAHCGNSLSGNFLWSLTMTDIHTAWTENRATWNKGAAGVPAQIQHIEKHLSFTIKGFDCDNGSEFLNHHLLRYFTNPAKPPCAFTRSRPYKKNDNAHVEQKNYSHVRQLLGYDRLDKPALVPMINDLYANE